MLAFKRSLNLEKIYFLMGLFSTMSIVTIPLGGSDISAFRALFFLVLILQIINLFKKKVIFISRDLGILNLWLLLSCFSCFLGWIILNGTATEFSKAAFSSLPKTLLFLLFVATWGSQEDRSVSCYGNMILKGILLGFILNLFWAIIDAGGFYLTGKSINNIVFSGYIARHSVRYGKISLYYTSGLIRAGGFNIDPANIGFIAPVITGFGLYKKKYWYLLLAIGGMIASASMTSILCSAFVTIVYLFNKTNQTEHKKLTKTGFFAIIFASIVVIGLLLYYWQNVSVMLSRAISGMLGRITSSYIDADLDDTIRWSYFIYFPLALITLNYKALFGLGFGTASYGYVTNDFILSKIGVKKYFPFDMENTYIAYLMDTGIIGLCLFLYMLRILYKKYKLLLNDNSTELETEGIVFMFCCIVGMIFSMAFYHYILFAPHILILTVGLSCCHVRCTNLPK